MIIPDDELEKVPVRECGERFVSLRGMHPKIFVDGPKKDWCRSKYGHLVRESLARKLARVAQSLPPAINLLIVDGYRPIEIQRVAFENALKRAEKKYPYHSKVKIVEFVQKYVANPDSYTYHSTGGVVDVTLIDVNGRELNMGKSKHIADKRISKVAKKNRTMLINAMEEQGFVNYPLEWWHWCYGERLWAAEKRKKHAIYGKILLRDLKKFL